VQQDRIPKQANQAGENLLEDGRLSDVLQER
jgi:hypothetical protein